MRIKKVISGIVAFVTAVAVVAPPLGENFQGVFTDKPLEAEAADVGLYESAAADNSDDAIPYEQVADFDGLSLEKAKTFYYDQLNDYEKSIYDSIKACGKDSYISEATPGQVDSMNKAYSALVSDDSFFRIYHERHLDITGNTDSFTVKTSLNPYGYDYNISKAEASVKQIADTVRSDDTYTTLYKLWKYCAENKSYDPYFVLGENRNYVYNDSAMGNASFKSSYTATTTTAAVSWGKVTGATGYKIYKYDSANKKWVLAKTITSASTTSATLTGLTSGTTTKLKINAYLTKGTKTYVGKAGAMLDVTTK